MALTVRGFIQADHLDHLTETAAITIRRRAQAITLEPRAGGQWLERDADGNETRWSKVLAREPPSRLLLGWQIRCEWGYDPELLTPARSGTTVTLKQRNSERLGTDDARHVEKLGGGLPGRLADFAQFADALA